MRADLLLLAVEEATHLYEIADAERDRYKYRSEAWWKAQESASHAFVNMIKAEKLYHAETGLCA